MFKQVVLTLTLAQASMATQIVLLDELKTLAQDANLNIKLSQASFEQANNLLDANKNLFLKNPFLEATIGPMFDNKNILAQVGVKLTQGIYISGELYARKQAAKHNKYAAQIIHNKNINIILNDLNYLYSEWQIATKSEKLILDEIEYANELQTIAEQRYYAGQISLMDLELIKNEKSSTDLNLPRANAKVLDARTKLESMIGQSLENKTPSEEFSPTENYNYDLDKLLTPELQVQEITTQSKQELLTAEQRHAWPELALSLSYQRDDNHTILFGLGFDLPIFQRNQIEIAKAQADLAEQKILAQINLTEKKLEAQKHLRDLHVCLDEINQIKLKLNDTAERGLANLKDAFNKKIVSAADVLQAKQALYQTKERLLNAYSCYFAAQNKLENSLGFNKDKS